jgi:hypothetical protein
MNTFCSRLIQFARIAMMPALMSAAATVPASAEPLGDGIKAGIVRAQAYLEYCKSLDSSKAAAFEAAQATAKANFQRNPEIQPFIDSAEFANARDAKVKEIRDLGPDTKFAGVEATLPANTHRKACEELFKALPQMASEPE